MITGDLRPTAEAVARTVGIAPEDVLAEVLPAQKAERVRALQEEGRRVAMVGDASTMPRVGGRRRRHRHRTGADVALEASDITLVGSDLTGVPNAIGLGRSTMRTIRQNLFWAFLYNILGIPIAAGALYPALGCAWIPCWRAPPWPSAACRW